MINIAEMMETSNLSLSAIARLTGYDRSGLKNWKRGGQPKLQMFIDVAECCGYELKIVKKASEDE